MSRWFSIVIGIVGMCASLAPSAHAQLPQISTGLSYLTSSQNTDGTWDNGTTSVDGTTATGTVLESLKLLNQSAGTQYTAGTAWFQGQSPQAVALIAQQIRVLGLTDTTALVASADSSRGGWGGYEGYETNPLDTALAIQALKSVNFPEQGVIFSGLTYLLTTQNPDGGWSLTKDDASNVFVTAYAVSAFSQFKTSFLAETQVNNAAAFLLSKQNPDGGFGTGASTVYETALAFIALVDSGQIQIAPLQNAINFLTTTQSANGSWNDDPYATALAVRALSLVKPDLTLVASDILVSPAVPIAGQGVTVTATIHNIGLETAGNIAVRFTDNGATVAEQFVSAMNSGGASQVSFNIPAITPYGDHNLDIVIDPANAIDEMNEANNTASTRIWAKSAADLVVYPEYLSISPDVPKPGDTITLTAMVANMGESAAQNVTATLYDGDPTGGVTLGSFTIAAIDSGNWGSGTISFVLATAGSHNLTLVVDPQHLITEANSSNNSAVKTVTVTAGTVHSVDLIIPPTGLQITPSRPRAGESVTVTVTAQNLGNSSASTDLELFDGDPATGILLHRSTITLSAGETRTVAVPWTVNVGVHTLKAYLDRAALVTETDKLNNSQALTVMADMVDIEISASDISIFPEQPMAGDPATVKVTVHNTGILPTGPFTVNLYNGDPAAGGVLLQLYAVTDLAGDAAQELSYSFTATRGTYRFYAVCDPDNRVAEMYEGNNSAIRSLLVMSSSEAKGPDLVPLEFDLSGSTTDPQNLRISGFAKVKFQNKGDDKVAKPFRITVFEDRDGDGLYTEGTDQALGFWDYASPLNPGMVGVVTINLAGILTFRDAPVYAMVDSGQAIFEQNKSNNVIRRGAACEARPATPIEPVRKWEWPGTASGSPRAFIYTAPIVMGTTDDNGDGRIDQNDVPTVLVNTSLLSDNYNSKIWALRGDTGIPAFSIFSYNTFITGESTLASSDIDNDGKPEIIVGKSHVSSANGTTFPTLAYKSDGTLKWDNTANVIAWSNANPYKFVDSSDGPHPAIADLDGDGVPEIIPGGIAVLNADGSVRCSRDRRGVMGGMGSGGSLGQIPLVVDLDLDGKPDILGGNVAYNADCSVKWQNSAIPDAYAAVGNFDDDPYPEIVLVTELRTEQYNSLYTKIWMLDHNGSVKWGPVYVPDLERIFNYSPAGFPVIADFDGDGQPEIGVRGISNYLILDKDGRLKRMIPLGTISYAEMRISPTVFDLNGDGRPEILINAGRNFKIFDGSTGALLFQEYAGWNWERTVQQNVIVADVGGTGHAEAVVMGLNSNGSDQVLVYRAKNNDWVSTRRVWNQDTYHATNVNDDGTIPKYESPSWLLNNSYRCQIPTTTSSNPYLATDLTASFVRVDMANYPASVTITARIGNGGAKQADAGTRTAFYDGDPAAGGVLIGSTVTSRPLNPGEYEDITLVWSAPADGNHTVQVVTNADNSQSECDKSNNSATLPVYVSSGKPDPGIVSSDIIAPASISEGSLTDILVTVRNTGTLQADNVMVRLYNGNPAQGGKQIGGDRVVTAIAAGGAVTLATTWNTVGAKGINYLYVVVDPNATTGDVNRGNNIAMKELLVTAAEKPDLRVGSDDITITPIAPGEGDMLNISALIHNLGTQTANVKVALYDGNPVSGGIKRGEAQIPWIIPASGSAPVTFTLDTIGLAGNHTLYVKADPDNAIDESNKANNQASRNITIFPSGVALNLATDKGEYSANEAVRLTVTIGNSRAEERNLSYKIQLLDKTGAYAATVTADTALHMAANAANASSLEWDTGTTYSGAYTAALQVSENGRMIAKVVTPINILPVKKADARIVSDKAAYGVNDQVAISATVTGTSPNYILSDLISRTSVIDSAGQILFTVTDNISSLMIGQRIELKHYWNSVTKMKGNYTLKLELLEGGVAIASAQTEFSIKGTAESGAGLTGAVSLQPATVEAGNSVTLSFSVANRGNEDIANLSLTLLIADPESGQVLKTLTGFADGALAINATQTGNLTISTTGFAPKVLLAILQSTLQGVTKSIANATFTIVDTIPPVLTVSTLSDNSYTNQETLNVSGTVQDNSGSAQVEINGASVPVAADGSFSQALLLKSADNAVEVKAVDLAGNKVVDSRTIHFDKTAPILTIDAPADNSKTAVSPIEVKGSVDETSTVTVKLNGVIQPVIMDGTRFSVAVIPEPRWNTIEVTAADLAGNTGSLKRSVLFDDQKPSLSITQPDQDIRTNKSSITISGKASDPYSAVGVTVAIDGAVLTPPVVNDIFSQVVTFADEKLYPVTITASNEVGTQTTVQRNIIFDKTPPNLTIDPVVTPTNAAGQTVSGTREEGALLTVTCATATAGAVEYPTATTWRAAVSGLSLGENRLQAETVDLAGNRTIATATILYVPKAPEVTISASPNQLWPPNKKLVAVTISGNVATFGSEIKDVTITVADEYGTYNVQGLRFGDTVMLEAWREGNDKDGRVYTITAVVTDQAGNRTTKSTTVIVPHDMGK